MIHSDIESLVRNVKVNNQNQFEKQFHVKMELELLE